ncbi:hypothetical protein C8F01DRAFT_1365690 [Mycena amicta]|nr:hypothetical protein C8F01DRAFT_1365690 [Mycena amicta]
MAPQQKSITDFFSLRKTLAAVPSAAASHTSLPTSSPPASSPPASSPPASSSPASSAMSRPGGESTPASLRLPEDIFDDDEPEDAAVLRRDYIRYEQRGTNGIMEWTFRLARQRHQQNRYIHLYNIKSAYNSLQCPDRRAKRLEADVRDGISFYSAIRSCVRL